MQIITIWLILRIISSITAAISSSIRPLTTIENHIPIWPISSPLSEWFERVFISPWNRWDVVWYSRIIENGYQSDNGTTIFHPLYPLLGKLLYILNIDTTLSLLIISSTAAILLLFVLRKLTILDFDESQTQLSILIFLLFPISFILFAPYPESLFLLFSVSCFYWLRKKNWFAAGLSGFLAVLTRQQGLFLIFPFIWELWEVSEKNLSKAIMYTRKWLAVGMIPLAYLIWIGYRIFIINDGKFALNNIQSVIYSIFISSSAVQVVPVQKFLWPWESFYLGILKLLNAPDIDMWINTILTMVFLSLLLIGWKQMRISYKIFTSVILMVSLSLHTGPIHPYMGLPRHLFLAFPVIICATPFFDSHKNFRLLYLVTGMALFTTLIFLFTLHAWVP